MATARKETKGMRVVAGKWRGRSLQTPDVSAPIRPTADRAREAVFNILYSAYGLPDGAAVLDVCCGTGAMGLEALSRGAAFAAFIDSHAAAIELAETNIKKFEAQGLSEIIKADVLALPPASRQYQLVFLDPPYEKGLVGPALVGLATRGWLAPDAVLVVETAAAETLTVPVSYKIIDERRYGAARVSFLCYVP